ncbi:hypothetical protein ACLOJK_034394 [Asimina triloba]
MFLLLFLFSTIDTAAIFLEHSSTVLHVEYAIYDIVGQWYMILATSTVSTFVKYIFYVIDMLMEGQWEKKAVYTFYLELIRDLLHLSLYLFFFLVIFVNYGVPLHLIRELYETFRNFKVRVADYIRYRKITSNMNDRFPDATPEELDAALVVPPENGSVSTGVRHGVQPNLHHNGVVGTSAHVPGGSIADHQLSQHQARLQAAAAAATRSVGEPNALSSQREAQERFLCHQIELSEKQRAVENHTSSGELKGLLERRSGTSGLTQEVEVQELATEHDTKKIELNVFSHTLG